MIRNNYYPRPNDSQILWLENFWNKILTLGILLGYTEAQILLIIADARWLVYAKGIWMATERQWHKSITDATELAETGTSGSLMVLPQFTPPPLPAAVGTIPAVVAVNQGALTRIFAFVQDLKTKPSYNDSIGMDLGVIGSVMAGPEYASLAPSISVSILNGQILIKWGWNGYSQFLDACEIQVDRGTGAGWEMLAFDTTPNYTDTATFPATFTNWKYRAIYRNDSVRVGMWSNVASVGVGG